MSYYIGCITTWELALYIAQKLNKILERQECFREGKLVCYPSIKPETILSKNPSREELIFYYERMCIKDV